MENLLLSAAIDGAVTNEVQDNFQNLDLEAIWKEVERCEARNYEVLILIGTLSGAPLEMRMEIQRRCLKSLAEYEKL